MIPKKPAPDLIRGGNRFSERDHAPAKAETMHLDQGSVTQSAGRGPTRTRPWLRRLVPVAVVVLLMAVVFAMGWHRFLSLETLVRHRAAIEGFVAARYGLAIAAFIAIYVAAVGLSIPGAVILTITGGVLFGWLVGALAAIVGATTGATIVFLIARGACGEAILRRVPVFPFWLVNLAPAVVGVRPTTFVLATALGIIPGTFAYALVGGGLDSVIAAQEAAYHACIAAGRADCRLDFSMAALVTPQLLAAFAALGVVALIPVALRKWRARRGCGMA